MCPGELSGKWSWPDLACILLILLVGSFLFFWRLGQCDLWATQEARAGVIAREMIQSGNYIVPTISGHLEAQKPILYYWAVVLCARFSQLAALQVRLPSALAALALALVTFGLARIFLTRRIALSAAFILMTSVTFWHLGRLARVDMLLTLFVTIAIGATALHVYGRDHGHAALFCAYAAAALATLTKGPIGLLIPLLVISTMLVIQYVQPADLLRAVGRLHLGIGILLFVALVLPWYLQVHWKTQGAFTRIFFLKHHWARFTGIDGVFKTRPLWFYLARLAGDFLPWSLFIPAALTVPWKESQSQRRAYLRFLVIWVLVIFIFFSITAFKRKEYILGLYPPLAILVATLLHGKNRWLEITTWFFLVLMIALVVVGFLMLTTPLFEYCLAIPTVRRHADLKSRLTIAMLRTFFTQHQTLLRLLCVAILGGVLWTFLALKRKHVTRGLATIFIFMITIFSIYLTMVLPHIDHFRSLRPLATKIRARVPKGQPMVFFRFESHPLIFYTQRKIPVIMSFQQLLQYAQQPGPVFVITDQRNYVALAAETTCRFVTLCSSAASSSHQIYLLTCQPYEKGAQ